MKKANITLRELAEAMHVEACKKYPNMPPHCVPKKTFSDKKANKLTTAIVCYLQDYLGFMAYRQSTEGRYRAGATYVDVVGFQHQMKGTYIPALKKGLGDVTAVIHGKYVSIEVKIGKDRQREDQKKFEAQLNRAGGAYMIVKDWEDFITRIKPYIKK